MNGEAPASACTCDPHPLPGHAGALAGASVQRTLALVRGLRCPRPHQTLGSWAAFTCGTRAPLSRAGWRAPGRPGLAPGLRVARVGEGRDVRTENRGASPGGPSPPRPHRAGAVCVTYPSLLGHTITRLAACHNASLSRYLSPRVSAGVFLAAWFRGHLRSFWTLFCLPPPLGRVLLMRLDSPGRPGMLSHLKEGCFANLPLQPNLIQSQAPGTGHGHLWGHRSATHWLYTQFTEEGIKKRWPKVTLLSGGGPGFAPCWVRLHQASCELRACEGNAPPPVPDTPTVGCRRLCPLMPLCPQPAAEGARTSLGFNYFVNILVIYIQDRCTMLMAFISPSRT